MLTHLSLSFVLAPNLQYEYKCVSDWEKWQHKVHISYMETNVMVQIENYDNFHYYFMEFIVL